MRCVALAAMGVLAGAASGQIFDPDPRYTIYIEVDRPVLEPGETAQILMRAGFDSDVDHSMHLVLTNLHWGPGPVQFEELRLIAPMATLCLGSPFPAGGCSAGEVGPEGVEGIAAGQIQFGGGASIYSNPNDPIDFWAARYAAPAAIAEPTIVDLSTRTMAYRLYIEPASSLTVERIDELIEGSATITIVPCRADFNADGATDLFDFLAFMNAFDVGDALADFDFDGELTVFDFLAFQNRFADGC